MQHLPESVLLVDSSVDEREMYAVYLRCLGFCTLQAANADDGYRFAAEMAPVVVVIASRLPGREDGLALTNRLKRHESTKGTPVIVLASSAADNDRELTPHAAYDRFMTKPCLPDRLGEAVQELLGHGNGPWVPHRLPALADYYRH